MSSRLIKAGAVAGLLAGGLLVLSAILYAVAPVEGVLDSGSEYLYQTLVLLAYAAVIIAIVGIQAAHRGQSRYGWVGTVGAVVAVVGYATVGVVAAIAMVRDMEGYSKALE
jgi:hypothetical protein